jgi:uroporphyrinogen decarboxylase
MTQRRFIRACRRETVDRIPVWLMRQAGRYMREYRELKERAGGFWGLCNQPEAVAEATLFAQKWLGTDAAIIFSDITLPAWAMGLPLEFNPGPRFPTPVRSANDARALANFDPNQKLGFVMEGIRKTRAGLPNDVSLIGFVGAPLTLASYMIEGTPGRTWNELKKLAYGDPDTLHLVLARVAEAVSAHAVAQVQAGCDALQLFDTTAGELAAAELHTFAFAYARRVIEAVKKTGVPVIYFARNVSAHLEAAADLGADVLGVDWGISMTAARKRVGERVALMGNLDPSALFCSPDVVGQRTTAILEEMRGAPGFVFNLGHGILPETPPENARHLVRTVQAWKPSS